MSAMAQNSISKEPPPFSVSKQETIMGGGAKVSQVPVRDGRFRTVVAPRKYLDAQEKIRRHARLPKDGDLDTPRFCECKLDAVVNETPNRTTFFLTPSAAAPISSYMVTIWRYKLDGATVDAKGAILNAKINNSAGNFSLVRSDDDSGEILKLSWIKDNSENNSFMIEIVATLSDLTPLGKKNASIILDDAATKLDKMLR
ncbi:hypothetical protein [Pseudorhodoferax sp.]|uniref:hypothetical protein n=1 Tax=Pseudorhodoferax sp. TaxID=1993553 RepID=UPI0039E406F3